MTSVRHCWVFFLLLFFYHNLHQPSDTNITPHSDKLRNYCHINNSNMYQPYKNKILLSPLLHSFLVKVKVANAHQWLLYKMTNWLDCKIMIIMVCVCRSNNKEWDTQCNNFLLLLSFTVFFFVVKGTHFTCRPTGWLDIYCWARWDTYKSCINDNNKKCSEHANFKLFK